MFVDFSLHQSVAARDRSKVDIACISVKGLCRISQGRLYLHFAPPVGIIMLSTSVIDYSLQLMNVVTHLENGNDETFCVSGDWYSNNVAFALDRPSMTVRIKEVNGGLFDVTVKFSDYKDAVKKHWGVLQKEVLLLYPEVIDNADVSKILVHK